MLSLLVFSAAFTSSVSKPSLCPERCQGWIFTTRSSIIATKITASIGSSTLDLWLRHKKYHRVNFQPIYTKPLKSSSSDLPCAATRRSKIRPLFHAPSVLLQSPHRCRHRNHLAPIYITKKESSSSDAPRALTCQQKFRWGLNHALTRPTRHWVTCWHHCWRYHCHVNPNWRHLANVISLRHTADIITGSWPLTLTFLLTIDFPLNTLILQK